MGLNYARDLAKGVFKHESGHKRRNSKGIKKRPHVKHGKFFMFAHDDTLVNTMFVMS